MGDPGAHLLISPLPQPTLSNLLLLILPPNPPPPPPSQKNQTVLGIGSCCAPLPRLPPSRPPPGPRRVPAPPPPAPILSLDDSHRCAGGLTAEATGPPLPSASQRQRDPRHPPRLGEAGPPRSKASGDHAGFRESSCTAAARSGATQGSREGETDEAV